PGVLRLDGRRLVLMDVGDVRHATVLQQVAGEVAPDVAPTLDGHLATTEGIGAEGGARGRLHATIHTVGGHRSRAYTATHLLGQTGHVGGLLPDVHHLRGAHSHVLGGDVAAVEAVHEAAEPAEHGLGLLGTGITDYHSLSTTEVEPGEGALVGHATAQ